MAPVVYCPAAEVDFEAFTAAFNLAYSDYFVPISMNPLTFRSLIARDDLSLESSIAALDGDAIVGMGMLGVRESHGWIGGMGVIPRYRRRGIGRQMMRHLLENARQHRLTEIRLEVIEANTGAYALYRQLGFIENRYLLILERDPKPLPEPVQGYTIDTRAPEDLLTYYAAFHDLSPNCWQRDRRSLQALARHVYGWAALNGGSIWGYAIGWANEHGVRLVDIATAPDGNRTETARALLVHLHQQSPDTGGSLYNLAQDDPALPAFKTLGYVTVFRQIEMKAGYL